MKWILGILGSLSWIGFVGTFYTITSYTQEITNMPPNYFMTLFFGCGMIAVPVIVFWGLITKKV